MNEMKLYYSDAYLTNFDAEVLRCEPDGEKFAIKLSETAFYPEGGGQPFDTGKIGAANVLEVFENNGEIIHYTDIPLAPKKTYACSIDWARRYSHMQHHTAEHVVTGIINKLYGADNVGFHIGDDYVTMDYNVFLTEDDVRKVEYLSSEAVFRNIPVKADFYDGAPDIAYRFKKELEGEIRIVTVEGYDVCACCGTQTKTTGELGLIKIVEFHKYKSGSRLYMLCGFKALADYNSKQKNAGEISALLSAKVNETAEAVKTLISERDNLKRRLVDSKNRVLSFIAAEQPENETVCVFEENLGPDELKKLAAMIAEKSEKTLVSAAFSPDGENYKYAVVYKKDDLKAFSAKLNAALCGRGGGKDVLMGSATKSEQEIRAFFDEL